MDIPADLQFTDPLQAINVAHGIVNSIPASWQELLYEAAQVIHGQTESMLTQDTITERGANLLSYIRHITQLSQGDMSTFLINALAPLFMVPDGTETDYVRRTFAEGVIKFSDLNFTWER